MSLAASSDTSPTLVVHQILDLTLERREAAKLIDVDISLVHHFSEDPTITHFEPHVPKTNPTQRPAVWAIDHLHAPLYWFPRDCPRATAWPRADTERAAFREVLATSANRLHAIEMQWLGRMQTTQLHRYDFDATDFEPWPEASGQWVSHEPVEPSSVTEVGCLLELHAGAGIELRLLPNLWPLVELMVDDRWDYSHVRLAKAIPAEEVISEDA